MAILKTIGSTESIQQRTDKRWSYPSGESTQVVFKGVAASVASAYETYKIIAGYTPSVDQVSYTQEKGIGNLTVTTQEDGPDIYELIANELSNPIYTHTYFSSLTAQNIHDVRKCFETGKPDSSLFDAKQLELLSFLQKGVESYLESSYVLREVKTLSNRSLTKADYASVNTVVTPPNVSAINKLIGALPSGEWLKKAPQVRMVSVRKWQVSTEWWWAKTWPVYLGGSGT